jgi:3',5'-cyclic-AMP phosphodiesterase
MDGPGNHDHYGIIRSRSHADPANPLYNRGMYRQYFGPDYYSFTYGGVHFIGLNTISPDDSAYYGDVDSVQMEWLKRDLSRSGDGTRRDVQPHPDDLELDDAGRIR